jgi:outer membrane lipoprotein-sorting protein
VKVPGIAQRHPVVRWLVPAGVAAVGALAAVGAFHNDPAPKALPEMTPDALVAAVQSTPAETFSGTVVSQVSLGLPQVPSVVSRNDTTSMASLLNGSHTLRVWYGGPHAQRIALLGATDETDLFRFGRQVWQYSSAQHVAIHTVLPHGAHRTALPVPDPANPDTMTPGGLARGVLTAAPATRVTVADDLEVADRAAYELVLTPRTTKTRVGSVRIAVDGATKVPLGVQVFARGSDAPAIDVAFTSIRFGEQNQSNFSFAPPPGAKVRHTSPDNAFVHALFGSGPATRGLHVAVMGSGWTSIVHYSTGRSLTVAPQIARPLGATAVGGSWGNGRLFESPLVCMLVINNGRMYVGPVDPAALFAAASAE